MSTRSRSQPYYICVYLGYRVKVLVYIAEVLVKKLQNGEMTFLFEIHKQRERKEKKTTAVRWYAHKNIDGKAHPNVPCSAATSSPPDAAPPRPLLSRVRGTPASVSPTREMPKSDSRALRYSSRRIFSGLMSPWIT